MPISVSIVEDDPVMRRTLTARVRACDDLAFVDAAESLASARRMLEAARPDVLLLDLGLPDGDGVELVAELAQAGARPQVMVISVFADEAHVMAAIEAGASGYLLKDAEAAAVEQAVREVHDGGSPISPAIARHILRRFRGSREAGTAPERAAPAGPSPLSPREQEVLELVARGYTNAEIAELLGVSYHTVTAHVKHIYGKLAVSSRSAAVFEARALGLLDTGA